MKEEIIKVEAKLYTCETCGKQSRYERDIQNCEKKHKREACKHNALYWALMEVHLFGVSVRCTDCGEVIKSAYLSDLAPETIENAEFQMKLFKLIKKYSKP